MGYLARVPSYLRALKCTNRREYMLPRMLTYIVTFTCNARCIMCDSWKMESPNDLSIEEIERIFGEMPRMDVVRLSGGEPFVRKDLLEIAHLAQRKLKPAILHITTNGFLTNRIIEFCEKRDKSVPLSILISLDGVREKHNYVRGRETAWDSAIKTLRELAPRREELGLSLLVNQTIVDAEGAEHYKLLREELRPLGVYHKFVMAYDASATYNLDRDKGAVSGQIGEFTTFGNFSEAHLRELLNEVEKDLKERPLGDRLAMGYYLRGIRNRLLHETNTPNPKCIALTGHMRLYPNGDVPTCQFSSRVVGNLRKQSFMDVWSEANPRIEKQRDWVRNCPGCWAECEVLPSAVYTGDLLRQALSGNRPGKAKGFAGIPQSQAQEE